MYSTCTSGMKWHHVIWLLSFRIEHVKQRCDQIWKQYCVCADSGLNTLLTMISFLKSDPFVKDRLKGAPDLRRLFDKITIKILSRVKTNFNLNIWLISVPKSVLKFGFFIIFGNFDKVVFPLFNKDHKGKFNFWIFLCGRDSFIYIIYILNHLQRFCLLEFLLERPNWAKPIPLCTFKLLMRFKLIQHPILKRLSKMQNV